MKSATILALVAVSLAPAAQADVSQSAPDHFALGFSATVAASPARTWAALAEVQHWWSSAHTWSGDAHNLSLKAEAGACFCERWKSGSSEHGRVVMALQEELLRLDAALGPLQEQALTGILSCHFSPGASDTTQLDVDYRVNGSAASGLDQFAAPVDQVLGMQIDRLLRYIDTGNPEPIAEAASEEPPSKRKVRAELIEEWAKQAAAEQAAKDAGKPESKSKPKPKPDAPLKH
jgi:uncharacterized protein YndB with AHSA1/START domain